MREDCFGVKRFSAGAGENKKPIQMDSRKVPLEEMIRKINETYRGNFTESDRIMTAALMDKLRTNKKLHKSALSDGQRIFERNVFPKILGVIAWASYMEQVGACTRIFGNQAKYPAIHNAPDAKSERRINRQGEEVRMCQSRVTLENEEGLNARLAGALAKEINSHESRITIEYDRKTVNAKSLKGMLNLHPVKDAEVVFTTEKPDEVQDVEFICAIIRDYAKSEKRDTTDREAERAARKAKRKETLLHFLPFL